MTEDARQAGVEIEVTEEMIEAGLDEMAKHWLGLRARDEQAEREALAAIYVRMRNSR